MARVDVGGAAYRSDAREDRRTDAEPVAGDVLEVEPLAGVADLDPQRGVGRLDGDGDPLASGVLQRVRDGLRRSEGQRPRYAARDDRRVRPDRPLDGQFGAELARGDLDVIGEC